MTQPVSHYLLLANPAPTGVIYPHPHPWHEPTTRSLEGTARLTPPRRPPADAEDAYRIAVHALNVTRRAEARAETADMRAAIATVIAVAATLVAVTALVAVLILWGALP